MKPDEPFLGTLPGDRALQTWASPLNEAFLSFVAEHPEAVCRSEYAPVAEITDLMSWPQQSWPLFLEGHRAAELGRISRRIVDLVRRTVSTQVERSPEGFAAKYRLTRARAVPAELLLMPSTEHLLSRQDVIVTSSGAKVVECNVVGGLGGWEGPLGARRLLDCEPIRSFLAHGEVSLCVSDTIGMVLEHAIEASLRWCGLEGACNLGILVHQEEEVLPVFGQFLQGCYDQVCRDRGISEPGTIRLCRPLELIVDGGVVCVDGQPVHGLIEASLTLPPPWVVQAAAERSICLFNGPAGLALMHKAHLATLSNDADRGKLSEDTTDFVRAHVPWSRELEAGDTTRQGRSIELLEHLLEHRGDFVIKPSFGAMGRGVSVGREMGADEWRASIREATDSDAVWVVQEHCESLSAVMQAGASSCAPHLAVASSFVAGRHDGPGFFRFSPRGGGAVINSSQGATEQYPLVVCGAPSPHLIPCHTPADVVES